MFSHILEYAPIVVAPFVLIMFSLISAYVFKFRLPRGGLGFDYIVFTLLIVIGLILGGGI